MAIPGPGTPIDLTDIATEFGDSAPHSVSEFYRGGGLVPDSAGNSAIPTSGAVALGNFYGAANRIALALTISSNTNNYNLYSTASANPSYVAGTTDVTLTVNPGVTVGSTSTGTYALSIPSSFNPGDNVTLVNNGTIVGRGGNGGNGGTNTSGGTGGAGGHGLYINRPVSINNTGTLAGAGGGGGGSGSAAVKTGTSPKSGGNQYSYYGGNGGGGGAGVTAGSGGSAGSAVVPGNAGSGGTATAGGAGGPRNSNPFGYTGAGGNGGARGSAGVAGENYGGTTTNARYPAAPGGAAGRYITGNPYATWVANGTRLGGSS